MPNTLSSMLWRHFRPRDACPMWTKCAWHCLARAWTTCGTWCGQVPRTLETSVFTSVLLGLRWDLSFDHTLHGLPDLRPQRYPSDMFCIVNVHIVLRADALYVLFLLISRATRSAQAQPFQGPAGAASNFYLVGGFFFNFHPPQSDLRSHKQRFSSFLPL